ncbi:hypothetical protein BDV93DRAFT_529113 [Ceratobasidium sp. AG-I]|nr:hypothetical protein BDV93DRAFT_529113 [Ceratobasidium sp. AG-I]
MLPTQEKGSELYVLRQKPRSNTNWRSLKACGLVISGYVLAQLEFKSTFDSAKLELSKVSRIGTRPVGDVQWYKCEDVDDSKIECGSIVVPLNYFNSSAGTATIAVAKYKADPTLRRGSVFVNPGGPGGAGTILAKRAGKMLADSRIGPHYDIVGFDPRGIGATTPKVQCFDSQAAMDQFYRNTVFELGYTQPPNTVISSSNSDPNMRFAQQRAFDDIVSQQRQALALFETQAKLCAKNMPNGGADLNYMGTASVVRDIAFMTDLLDGHGANINYWGGSYGSILGATLFNMIPDRIGKGMIEAVANPAVWVDWHSYQWMDNFIQDADEAYHWFLNSCAKAGEAKCALAKGNITAEVIEERIEAFMEELYENPMPSVNSIVPAYLTAGTVQSKLYDAMERPSSWPLFASILDEAMRGDPTQYLNRVLPDPDRDRYDHAELARFAVTCIDSLPYNKSDPSSFPTPDSIARGIVARVNSTSKYFGGSTGLTDVDGGCQFWPVDGVERYAGPWNKALANPVVVVSSTVDPITPLASAKFINDQLGDSSRLITVNAPGHGIPFPSLCQFRASVAYFSNGTLPKDGLSCETEYGAFEEPDKAYGVMSEEDRELVKSGAELAKLLQTIF